MTTYCTWNDREMLTFFLSGNRKEMVYVDYALFGKLLKFIVMKFGVRNRVDNFD